MLLNSRHDPPSSTGRAVAFSDVLVMWHVVRHGKMRSSHVRGPIDIIVQYMYALPSHPHISSRMRMFRASVCTTCTSRSGGLDAADCVMKPSSFECTTHRMSTEAVAGGNLPGSEAEANGWLLKRYTVRRRHGSADQGDALECLPIGVEPFGTIPSGILCRLAAPTRWDSLCPQRSQIGGESPRVPSAAADADVY